MSNTALVQISQARALLAKAVRDDDCFAVKSIRDQAATIADHIRRVSQGKDDAAGALVDASEVKLRAERALGELDMRRRKLPKGQRGQGRGGKKSGGSVSPDFETLADLNLTKEEVKRWRDVAKIPEAAFEKQLEAHRASLSPVTTAAFLRGGKVSGSATYNSDEWYTPKQYIDAAREVLGEIDLDPASCAVANERVGAQRIYTVDDDGLSQPWRGRVWLNPPFSKGDAFAEKLLAEYRSGCVDAAILLQNAGTDTRWFHALAATGPLCLTLGRIAFELADGTAVDGNRQGQVFFYLGIDGDRFCEVFAKFGTVGKLGAVA